MAEGRFVSYLRVSTDKQGRSGLGLEAQRAAVASYLNGGDWTLIQEFVEVESGGKNDRPVLAQALAACRVHRATLVIAKLDRLSRNAAFLLTLRDAGVDFLAADMPNANRLTVGVMALVAEQEREAISARTKAALAAAKARGKRLGAPDPAASLSQADRERGGRIGRAKLAAKAAERATDLRPLVQQVQAAGITSANGIAKALNERGVPTPSGGRWQAVQVQRLLARLEAPAEARLQVQVKPADRLRQSILNRHAGGKTPEQIQKALRTTLGEQVLIEDIERVIEEAAS